MRNLVHLHKKNAPPGGFIKKMRHLRREK